MFYVYILKSEKDNKFYIGSTSDISRRLAEHNSGKVKSTKHRIPFTISHTESFQTLKEARQRELQIKRMKGGNQFKNLILSVSSRW